MIRRKNQLRRFLSVNTAVGKVLLKLVALVFVIGAITLFVQIPDLLLSTGMSTALLNLLFGVFLCIMAHIVMKSFSLAYQNLFLRSLKNRGAITKREMHFLLREAEREAEKEDKGS